MMPMIFFIIIIYFLEIFVFFYVSDIKYIL